MYACVLCVLLTVCVPKAAFDFICPKYTFNNYRFLSSEFIIQLVSWCFEPSQPLGFTSGLNTTSEQSLSYSAHKSLTIDHNSSTAQLFQKHSHTHIYIYITSHTFLQNHNFSVSQLEYFSLNVSPHKIYFKILKKTYQSLSGSQNISPDSHFGTVNTKISSQNISF